MDHNHKNYSAKTVLWPVRLLCYGFVKIGNMEVDKRKRTDDGEIEGKKRKAREDDGATEDEEVEEFFAILRRINMAIKYFEKRNGVGEGGREFTAWRPSFQWQDFEEVNGVKETERGYLDLNADPETKRGTVSSTREINN